MPLGSGRPREPLFVIPMALALVLAAFAGGALGLIWHKFFGGGDKPADTTAAVP